MSNPGVITLSQTELSNASFCIEDNIGEAIHFHMGNMRLDLTINEYLRIVEKVRNTIEDLVTAPGFKIEYFDELFLMQIAKWLPDLEKVSMEKVYLKDLYIDTQYVNEETGEKVETYEPLSNSRVIKYLHGNREENDEKEQVNLFKQSNAERIHSILNKIRSSGYPFNNKYIMLINESNVVRDGQHRAACLWELYGNIEVDVVRLYFRGGKYGINLKCNYREAIRDFFERHKHIYIYGAGVYAMALKKKFDSMKLAINGFLVTKKEFESLLGLPVYEVKDIALYSHSSGVVFGLRQQFHDDVKSLLNANEIHSYYIYDDWEMEKEKIKYKIGI